jgi:hypothetical protein
MYEEYLSVIPVPAVFATTYEEYKKLLRVYEALFKSVRRFSGQHPVDRARDYSEVRRRQDELAYQKFLSPK